MNNKQEQELISSVFNKIIDARGKPEVLEARAKVGENFLLMNSIQQALFLEYFIRTAWTMPSNPAKISEIVNKNLEASEQAAGKDNMAYKGHKANTAKMTVFLNSIWEGVTEPELKSWGIILTGLNTLLNPIGLMAFDSLFHGRGGFLKYQKGLYKLIDRMQSSIIRTFAISTAYNVLEYYATNNYLKGYKFVDKPYKQSKHNFEALAAIVVPDEDDVAKKIRAHVQKNLVGKNVNELSIVDAKQLIPTELTMPEQIAIAYIVKPSLYLHNRTATLEGKKPKQAEFNNVVKAYYKLIKLANLIDPNFVVKGTPQTKKELTQTYAMLCSNIHFILGRQRMAFAGTGGQLNGNEARIYDVVDIMENDWKA